ncbi:MAG: 3-oxoadipate enol-lactonase [Actinobacteria bacterium]|nr:3-oxoadipate enol-lactonase [Actinomycetota bacterium]
MTAVALHHVVSGGTADPPLLLLGSLGSDVSMWEPQLGRLERRLRIVRVDLRGNGASPAPAGPYAIADLAADVVALLDELDIAGASVCGLSLGGMVAMRLALDHPDRLDRLVLCCTAARLGPPQGWLERADLVRRRGTEAVSEAVVGRWFTPSFAGANPALMDSMKAMVAATPSEGYAACCEAIAGFDVESRLGSVEAPTLVLSGNRDEAAPPSLGRLIADGIPDAAHIEVPAAHLASYEAAAQVSAAIAAHLLGTPKAA